MNELINAPAGRNNLRWQLLATVCGVGLLLTASKGEVEAAEDAQPSIWIEVGGQLEKIGSDQQPFAPPFTLVSPAPAPFSPISPLQAQASPRYAIGGEGSVTFSPPESQWVFAASVRYGRSNGKKHVHQQTSLGPFTYIRAGQFLTPTVQNFADTKSKQEESHAIVDFEVGRDVGLGAFGRHSQSTINFGVRFAQFGAHSQTSIYGHPDIDVRLFHTRGFILPFKYFHNYLAASEMSRSFHGLGPSLSWEGSTPLSMSEDSGAIAIDWGLNGAILFGRQKVSGTHSTTGYYFSQKYGYAQQYKRDHVPIGRSRSVVVPNVGGFAAISFRRGNAKLSLGYKADFFIGAMDDGDITRHEADHVFHGPFATIAIGL